MLESLELPFAGMAFLLVILAFVVAIGLTVTIFFILTLRNCLRQVRPENRRFEPNNTWLLLIPLFSLVYNFFVVKGISESLQNEYEQLGENPTTAPAYQLGLAYSIASCLTWVPMAGSFIAIAAFVLFIVYWVQIHEHKNRIATLQMQYQTNNDIGEHIL
ncbi:MAG: hypothetical protein ACK4HE_01495 [Chitinophagaceae bacterium]